MSTSSNYLKLETLLAQLYSLFEYESAVYVDELGYKWYDLLNVLDILEIDKDEYISDFYLIEIMGKTFISEEGINVLLLDYDNEYQDDVRTLLTSEVMPDIKSDMMYVADHLINDLKAACRRYEIYLDNSTEKESNLVGKIQKYTSKKMNRRQNQQKFKQEKRNKK